MYEIWLQEIEELALRANRWLTFSTVCGWIGFGLSMLALVYLLYIKRQGGRHGKR